MFFLSLVRWTVQLGRLFQRPDRSVLPRTAPTGEIDPDALDAWVQAVAREDEPS